MVPCLSRISDSTEFNSEEYINKNSLFINQKKIGKSFGAELGNLTLKKIRWREQWLKKVQIQGSRKIQGPHFGPTIALPRDWYLLRVRVANCSLRMGKPSLIFYRALPLPVSVTPIPISSLRLRIRLKNSGIYRMCIEYHRPKNWPDDSRPTVLLTMCSLQTLEPKQSKQE